MNSSADARIVIGQATHEGYATEIEGPGGEFPGGIIPMAAESPVRTLIEQVQNMLDQAHIVADPGSHVRAHECLQELGRYLFEALNVNDKLQAALDISHLAANQKLRIQLRIRDAQVDTWPWETLYDASETGKSDVLDSPYLALSSRILFSRYPEQPVPVPQPEKLDKLQVLIVSASPKDCGSLDQLTRQEIDALRLLGVVKKRVVLNVLEHTTRESLKKCLQAAEHPFHIVHFIGHGYCDESAPGGAPKTGVILERNDGYADRVNANEFADILRTSQVATTQASDNSRERRESYPRLVTIAACHSARTTFSVARTLIEARLPAVIGMRSRISPAFAILFNEGLYDHLLDGHPIDEAAAECRRQIYRFRRDLSWHIPVLYLRAKDGILFDFNGDSKESAQWLIQLQLFSGLVGPQARQAFHALFELGAGALTLAVAVVLAYPLAAVRAGAATLLREMRYDPAAQESIINLVGPAMAHEPEVTIRREMAQILTRPGKVSASADSFLRDWASDPDPEIQKIAQSGLNLSVSSDGLTLQFDRIHNRLELAINLLSQLSNIVGDALQQNPSYATYLEQVEGARDKARELARHIDRARSEATSMTADQVWEDLRPQVANWVASANRATVTAQQAVTAAQSLSDRLMLALNEVATTLELEISLMRELDEITREVDGTVISDALGDASVAIVRRALEINIEGKEP